jgi:hypothetical protein
MSTKFIKVFIFTVLTMILVGVGNFAIAAQEIVSSEAAPFAVDRRPRPAGKNPDILLPLKIGAFTRAALPPGTKIPSDEDLNVTYKSGNDSIFFGVSITDTEKDAVEAIKVTRQEAIDSRLSLKGEQYRVDSDPGYFRINDFMSWNRGRYFFYAKASSPAALEKFMKAFPY